MMKKEILVVALAVLLCSAGVGAAAIELDVRGAAVLPAGEICLRQVAGITGADPAVTEALGALPLGATPWPGNARNVGRDHIVMYLGRAGYDVAGLRWKGATACTVTVRTMRISPERIVKAGREYLAGLPPLQADQVSISVDRMPHEVLVAGDKALSLEATANGVDRPWGRIRVHVRVLDGEKVLSTIPVVFLVTSRQTALYAARPIARGDTVERGQLEEREVVVGANGDADVYLARADDVVGKKALRPIPAGAVLTPALFAEPLAVRRGDNVSVILRSDHMEILAKGVAQRDAHIGDVVAVKILVTGKELSCRVRANGAVEVAL